MSEIEAKIMALKDFLINQSQETDTTYFGNINVQNPQRLLMKRYYMQQTQ